MSIISESVSSGDLDGQDSVVLRTEEFGTSEFVESQLQAVPDALDRANSTVVGKKFFVPGDRGPGPISNEEVFFRHDLTTPAVRSVMGMSADKTIKTAFHGARRPICLIAKEISQEKTSKPALEEQLQAVKMQLELDALRAKHSQVFKDDKILAESPRALSLVIPTRAQSFSSSSPRSPVSAASLQLSGHVIEGSFSRPASGKPSHQRRRSHRNLVVADSPVRVPRADDSHEPNPSLALESVRQYYNSRRHERFFVEPPRRTGKGDRVEGGEDGEHATLSPAASPRGTVSFWPGSESDDKRPLVPARDPNKPFSWMHDALNPSNLSQGQQGPGSNGIIRRWPLSLPDESQSLDLRGGGFEDSDDDDDDDDYANDCSVRDGSERGAVDGQGVRGDKDKDKDRDRDSGKTLARIGPNQASITASPKAVTRSNFFTEETAQARKQQRQDRRWKHSYVSADLAQLGELSIRQLMQVLVESSSRGANKGGKEMLAAELSQWCAGFRRLDMDGDGLVSRRDLALYNDRLRGGLTADELDEMSWELDDEMRGGFSFEEVRKHMLRLRTGLRAEEEAGGHIGGGARGRNRYGASGVRQGKSGIESGWPRLVRSVPAPVSESLRHRPYRQWLLYRLLFFASFQGERSQLVHVLSALQVSCEL